MINNSGKYNLIKVNITLIPSALKINVVLIPIIILLISKINKSKIKPIGIKPIIQIKKKYQKLYVKLLKKIVKNDFLLLSI